MNTLEDTRWQTVLDRTAADDFLYAVTTQGVFCQIGRAHV